MSSTDPPPTATIKECATNAELFTVLATNAVDISSGILYDFATWNNQGRSHILYGLASATDNIVEAVKKLTFRNADSLRLR